MADDGVLVETLRLAVPMHMDELRGLPHDVLVGIARQSAVTVGSHGDALQFGGRHCAEAFNALARGLAVAALTAWGGVTFRGLHWCHVPTCRDRHSPHDMPTWPDEARIDPPGRRRPVTTVPTGGRT